MYVKSVINTSFTLSKLLKLNYVTFTLYVMFYDKCLGQMLVNSKFTLVAYVLNIGFGLLKNVCGRAV